MEVLVDNKNGTVWDMPVSSVEWSTARIGKAGVLNVELVVEEPLKHPVNSGDIIRVIDGEHKVFYGFVFDSGYKKSGAFAVKAYDQLRYMKTTDTYVLPSSTATVAIRSIATKLEMKIGTLEDTGYKVPGIVEEDKEAFDVVSKFLDSSLIATNRNFVLFDNFGSLDLKNINNMKISADTFYIGEDSLLFDYEYKKSVDSETFNRVKLVQDNKETSKREVYIFQDSANIARWGRLQEYRKVDEKMKAAQIEDLGDKLLKLHNREMKTLTLDCIGDWRVRAGNFVYIYIEKIGVKEYFLVDDCSHKWVGGVHAMSLKVKVI